MFTDAVGREPVLPDNKAVHLFTPWRCRGVQARNRVVISPMQQYSAQDGLANDWHLVHLGRFALGGAGTVFVGATAVQACGRNTHGDLGLWHDGQVGPLARIARNLKALGAVPAIQLGHTGRKGGLQTWWFGHGPLTPADAARGEAAWPVVAPSARPVSEGWPTPEALSLAAIGQLIDDYGQAARRAFEAGFELLEIHGAHGYLIHQFLSPVANGRDDAYGGDAERRRRFALDVATSVRRHWPEHLPLAWRVSLADLDQGDISRDDLLALCLGLRERGVDLIDASSAGGIGSYPTRLQARRSDLDFRADDGALLRREAGLSVIAVGNIVTPEQAEALLEEGCADLIAIGREALYNPNWALHAERALGLDNGMAHWPRQHRMWLARRAGPADAVRDAATAARLRTAHAHGDAHVAG